MPTGPREPDRGTSNPGPLGAPVRPKPAPVDDWRVVPDKPYLERNAVTGRLRTRNYTIDTPLKD